MGRRSTGLFDSKKQEIFEFDVLVDSGTNAKYIVEFTGKTFRASRLGGDKRVHAGQRVWGFLNVIGHMDADYIKLAQIAYDTVLQTMQEGEQTHPDDDWQEVDVYEHTSHAWQHINDYYIDDTTEDHVAHALTRCAMIKYLEANHEQNTRQTHK